MHRIRRTTRAVDDAARRMRREPTGAEAVLWEAVRGYKLAGLKFRRQHPVGRFVLDLVCPAARLVVEVDGGVHEQQTERDEERSRVLESAGYRVVRFSNEEVLSDLPAVARRIVAAARDRTAPPPPELGEGWRP